MVSLPSRKLPYMSHSRTVACVNHRVQAMPWEVSPLMLTAACKVSKWLQILPSRAHPGAAEERKIHVQRQNWVQGCEGGLVLLTRSMAGSTPYARARCDVAILEASYRSHVERWRCPVFFLLHRYFHGFMRQLRRHRDVLGQC